MVTTRRGPALRVLYSFPHVLGRSGIATTALQQVLGLHAAGAHLHVVCADTFVPLPRDIEVSRSLAFGRLRLPHRAIGVDRAYRWHDRVAERLLARPGRSYDVVHTWPLGGLRTLRTARRVRTLGVREAPNTHTAHAYRVAAQLDEALGLTSVSGYSHSFDAERLALEEQEYAAAAVITVASDAVRSTFIDQGIPPEKLALHAYGYDDSKFTPPDPAPPVRPTRPFTACFLGSLEPRKGLHVALEAWRRSRVADHGARLIVRGRPHPGYLDTIGPALREQAGVDIGDFVTDPTELLRACDALILPSFEEGSALVTYEAQASGCALLVSTATGARCTHGRNGLVHEPGDVDELADHLRTAVDDPDGWLQMRANALAAAQSLTWTHAGEELLEVFERELARRAQ